MACAPLLSHTLSTLYRKSPLTCAPMPMCTLAVRLCALARPYSLEYLQLRLPRRPPPAPAAVPRRRSPPRRRWTRAGRRGSVSHSSKKEQDQVRRRGSVGQPRPSRMPRVCESTILAGLCERESAFRRVCVRESAFQRVCVRVCFPAGACL